MIFIDTNEKSPEVSDNLGNSSTRTIYTPTEEIEIPPEDNKSEIFKEISFKEKKELWKDIKNFDFLYFILGMMFLVYFVDMVATKGNSSLKTDFFESLKSVLLIAAGYVFGKNKDT